MKGAKGSGQASEGGGENSELCSSRKWNTLSEEEYRLSQEYIWLFTMRLGKPKGGISRSSSQGRVYENQRKTGRQRQRWGMTVRFDSSWVVWEEAWMRSLINVLNVKRASARAQLFFNTRRSILERNPINVQIVGKVSFRILISFSIAASTLGKSPINVMSVERGLNRAQISFSTR